MIWLFENDIAIASRTLRSFNGAHGVSSRTIRVSMPGVDRHFGAVVHSSLVSQLASCASPVCTWEARTEASVGNLNVTSVICELLPSASLGSFRPHQSGLAVSLMYWPRLHWTNLYGAGARPGVVSYFFGVSLSSFAETIGTKYIRVGRIGSASAVFASSVYLSLAEKVTSGPRKLRIAKACSGLSA